ncbi:MAG: DUF2259 domain-containing protein [Kastovskya adunca ATA6-11-RM4]|jgi:predicted secreted protein|nr:DUF2259 domain-containing protein [Kastovskya adunca ATA6-11-RM4]
MKHFKKLSILFATSTLLFFSAQALAAIFKTSHQQSGFSADSRHYLYLETTRDPVSEVPQAFLQIVNLPSNSCVTNGCIRTGVEPTSPTTTAAAKELLDRTATLRQRLNLRNLKQGSKLPVLKRTRDDRGVETYTFRLNDAGQTLDVRMFQEHIPSVVYGGDGNIDRAALGLEVNYNYRKRTLSYLNNYREGIIRYNLREVRLSPNKQNVVIVMNVIKPASLGAMQATFVQSFPL